MLEGCCPGIATWHGSVKGWLTRFKKPAGPTLRLGVTFAKTKTAGCYASGFRSLPLEFLTPMMALTSAFGVERSLTVRRCQQSKRGFDSGERASQCSANQRHYSNQGQTRSSGDKAVLDCSGTRLVFKETCEHNILLSFHSFYSTGTNYPSWVIP